MELTAIDKVADNARAAPWWLFVLAFAVIVVTSIWVYPLLSHWDVFATLSQATSQWLDGRFMSMLIVQSLRIVVVLFGIGRLGIRDLGIGAELVRPAVIVLVLTWLCLQSLRALEGFAWTGGILMRIPWDGGIDRLHMAKPIAVGSVCEEFIFRGFFMLQFYKLARERSAMSLGWAAVISVIASASLFAVAHVPGRLLAGGENFGDIIPSLFNTLLVGLVLGFVFARTGNILISAGLHCLFNMPINAVRAPEAIPPFVQWAVELSVIVVTVHFILLRLPHKARLIET
jgi:membrane protease YdiL (CAAX protease family)